MAYKGKYRLQNRDKYRGDPDNIIYRSLWEVKVMDRLDRDPNVLWWSSERTVVPYVDKTCGRTRRYYPDFLVGKTNGDTLLVEVKPGKESPKHAPPPKRRRGQSEAAFLREAMTWGRNKCKWDSAEAFCRAKGWKFVVLTERELGLKRG